MCTDATRKTCTHNAAPSNAIYNEQMARGEGQGKAIQNILEKEQQAV